MDPVAALVVVRQRDERLERPAQVGHVAFERDERGVDPVERSARHEADHAHGRASTRAGPANAAAPGDFGAGPAGRVLVALAPPRTGTIEAGDVAPHPASSSPTTRPITPPASSSRRFASSRSTPS